MAVVLGQPVPRARRGFRWAGSVAGALLLITGTVSVSGVLGACSSDDTGNPSPIDAGSGAFKDVGSAPGPVQTETEAAATIGNPGGNVLTTRGVGVEIPPGALPN